MRSCTSAPSFPVTAIFKYHRVISALCLYHSNKCNPVRFSERTHTHTQHASTHDRRAEHTRALHYTQKKHSFLHPPYPRTRARFHNSTKGNPLYHTQHPIFSKILSTSPISILISTNMILSGKMVPYFNFWYQSGTYPLTIYKSCYKLVLWILTSLIQDMRIVF